MDDQTYAVSLYVDLRLGLIGQEDKIRTPEEANRIVSARYGPAHADYAQNAVDGTPKERR